MADEWLYYPDNATLRLPFNESGATRLPTTINIAGTDVAATFIYNGKDATSSSWPEATGVGETLSITGSGDDPTIGEASPFLDGGCVGFNKGKYYQASDTSFGNLGTDDFVLVVVFRQKEDNSFKTFLGKKPAPLTTDAGWGVCQSNNDRMRLAIADGVDLDIPTIDNGGGATGPWPWVINVITCNRNEATTSAYGLRNYYNANFSNSNLVDSIGDMDNTDPFVIGNSDMDLDFYAAALWQGADLFTDGATTETEANDIATELAYRVMGIWPFKAEGTALPTIRSRASAAYSPLVTDSGVVRFHYVGTNWLRVGSMLQEDGSTEVAGYLSEDDATQYAVSTEDLTFSGWQVNLASTANGFESQEPSPVIGANVGVLYAESGNGNHYLLQTTTSVPNSTGQIYVKKYDGSANDFIRLQCGSSGATRIILDLSTGDVTTDGSPNDGGAFQLGNGWWCIWHSDTCDRIALYTSPTSTLSYNQGSQQPMLYICAPNHIGLRSPSTYIPNAATSGTVSRSADGLEFKMDDGNCPSPEVALTVEWTAWTVNHDVQLTSAMWTLSDGNATANRLRADISTTSNRAEIFMASSEGLGGTLFLTSGVSDGFSTDLRFTARGNDQVLTSLTDSESASAIGGASIPNDIDQFDIGGNRIGSFNPNGLISNIRVYPKSREA